MSDDTRLRVVLTTTSNSEEAEKLSRLLLDSGLAACCNIISGISSMYVWKGKINHDSEVLILIKTMDNHVEAITELIKINHSYEMPEIIALPINGGSMDYINWVKNETGS
jgi:periplasmic divalent cation tolerance protein